MPRLLSSAILSIVLLQFLQFNAEAATILVPTNQPTIQAGINAAVSGVDVVYLEIAGSPFTGVGNQDVDFLGKAITVTADPGVIVDCQGLGCGFLFVSGEGSNSILEKVDIRNANSTITPPCTFPAGVYIDNASTPTVRLCRFENNFAGIYVTFLGAGTFSSNDFDMNTIGALVTTLSSASMFAGNTFQNNQTGLSLSSSGNVTADGNTFVSNTVGLQCNDSDAQVLNNTFSGHTEHAIAFSTKPITITGNRFEENSANSFDGGAILGAEDQSGTTTIEFNEFCNNTSAMGGGAIAFVIGGGTGTASIANNTFYGNGAPLGGSLVLGANAPASINVRHNIFAFGTQGEPIYCQGPQVTVTCNDLYGNAGGNAVCAPINAGYNFSLDPQFCDPSGCDMTLHSGSPCLPANNACANLIGAKGAACQTLPKKPQDITIYYPPSDEMNCSSAAVDTFHLAWFSFDSGAVGWTGDDYTGRGDFAALYPGISVLQEDLCRLDVTDLWAFFNDPNITGYACHLPDPQPAQGAVPYVDANGLYMSNEIWSPAIALAGAGNEYHLLFDVYRDLPLDNVVFYHWRIRTRVGAGPWGPWQNNGTSYYGHNPTLRDWVRQNEEISTYIDPAATEMQVALGVKDLCYYFCGVLGTGACHGHAPLFDNVHVLRVNSTGPRWSVRPIDLFQDNFTEDGTLVGNVRADAAADIRPVDDPVIDPGDSVVAGVSDAAGLAVDPNTGVGAAVYCYLSVWPTGQAGKTGPDLEAPETRAAVGKRYPYVGSTIINGTTWFCYRMDDVVDELGNVISDRYCFDMADNVLTPCDTVCFFYCAENSVGGRTYYTGCVTPDIQVAAANPMEFTCLPAGGWKRGGDILYVDDYDGHGAQPVFDQAFISMGLNELVDRYDVRGPEYCAGNGLGSRVKNIQQLTSCYRKIIWSSGDLDKGTVGNAQIGQDKSDDFGVLYDFLDTSPNTPGIYFTGDNIGEEWDLHIGGRAVDLRADYIAFNLVTGDHTSIGEPVSPCLTGVFPNCFNPFGLPEQLIAFGGCPSRGKFDVFTAATTVPEMENDVSGVYYSVSQTTPNHAASFARVMLEGFSFHEIANKAFQPPPMAYKTHLHTVLQWLQNVVPEPVAVPTLDPPFTNYLAAAFPNPFNPTTTIRYGLRESIHVTLRVYNTAGQEVRTLVDELQTPREDGFRVVWDGRNDAGSNVASGIYFYRLQAGSFTKSKKMALLK